MSRDFALPKIYRSLEPRLTQTDRRICLSVVVQSEIIFKKIFPLCVFVEKKCFHPHPPVSSVVISFFRASVPQRVCQVFVCCLPLPVSPGVSGVKTKPVSFHRREPWTHFLFEVNHVEVYNNIKFPFTRFAGNALFLRQKTYFQPNKNRVFILRNVKGIARLRNAYGFFLLFILILSSLDNIEHPSPPPPLYHPISFHLHLNDPSVCRTTVCYLLLLTTLENFTPSSHHVCCVNV